MKPLCETLNELHTISSTLHMVTPLPAQLAAMLADSGYEGVLVAARRDGDPATPGDHEGLAALLVYYDVDSAAADACDRIAAAFYPDGDLGAAVGADELETTCNILLESGFAAAQFRGVIEDQLQRLSLPLGVITVEMKDNKVHLLRPALAEHFAVDTSTALELIEGVRELPKGTTIDALWSALVAGDW